MRRAEVNGRKKRSPNRIFLFAILIFLLSIVLLSIYGIFSSSPIRFNSWLWKEDIGRYRMVDDLMDSHILEGMDREEVTKLLGEGQTHIPTGEYAEKGYSIRYYTRDPDYRPYAVFVVIFDLEDICMGSSTDITCPY